MKWVNGSINPGTLVTTNLVAYIANTPGIFNETDEREFIKGNVAVIISSTVVYGDGDPLTPNSQNRARLWLLLLTPAGLGWTTVDCLMEIKC